MPASTSSAAPRLREPRMRDIARHLGLSPATVSLALRENSRISSDTRQRVTDAVRSLGYDLSRRAPTPAARLKRLGFISVNQPVAAPDDEDSALAPMTRVFSRHAVDFGATVSIQSVAGDPLEPAAARRLEEFASDMDGLLVSGIITRPFIRLLRTLGKPFLVIGYTELEPADPDAHGLHQIAVDSVAMGRAATLHLLARGCKSIAFMAPQFITNFTYELWLRGYYSALDSAGVPASASMVSAAYPNSRLLAFLPQLPELDGLVTPDASVVTVLLNRGPRRKIPRIPLENIAVGVATLREARLAGVEKSALVICDIDDLTRAAIPRLLHLISHPDPVGSLFIRPFHCANMHI